ncbi:MAG: hemin uptake protein HemP [Pseudomonadota bacterium]
MSLAMPVSSTLSLPRQAPRASGEASSPTMQASAQTCVDSNQILKGQKAVEISHNGSTYRLQATRLGKLILTK